MERIIDLAFGDEVQAETGYTNWDRADNEFYCKVAGIDEKGWVILDAQNAVCFDGRNKIQPFFLVPSDSPVEGMAHYKKIPGCYVIWHIIGMDEKGRFLLNTHAYECSASDRASDPKQEDYRNVIADGGRQAGDTLTEAL